MSAIRPHREITPRRPDWLADEPVSGEPVCGANSLLTGNLTGNFTKIGPFGETLPRQNAAESVSCRTIPYKMKQGINSRQTGNLLSRAGNLQRLAGNCPPCAGISPELSRFPHSVVETLTLVISRRHTSSSRMIDNSFQCSFPTCSRSLCRASCGRQLVLRETRGRTRGRVADQFAQVVLRAHAGQHRVQRPPEGRHAAPRPGLKPRPPKKNAG